MCLPCSCFFLLLLILSFTCGEWGIFEMKWNFLSNEYFIKKISQKATVHLRVLLSMCSCTWWLTWLFTASLFLHAKRARSTREYRVEFASPTQSSLPFCPSVQFSRDSIREFKDQIEIRETEGCEQPNAYITKRTLHGGSKIWILWSCGKNQYRSCSLRSIVLAIRT